MKLHKSTTAGVQIFLIVLAMFSVVTLTSFAQDDGNGHDHSTDGEPRLETARESPIELNPARGSDIGLVFEAFLSPHQQGGEEADTPDIIPDQFRSTAPSVPRNERDSHGHAVLAFTNDLSRAFVYLAVENVNPDDVVMLHIHCGRPGQLGPILIDFGLMGDVGEFMADGYMAIEITNADIEAVVAGSEDSHGQHANGSDDSDDGDSPLDALPFDTPDLPEVDIDLPDVGIDAPDLPEVDIDLPEVDLPLDGLPIQLPSVEGFLNGCDIVPGIPDKVKTVGGMAYIAVEGELYFNLHTAGQTYFGDIRGAFYPVNQD